MRIILYCSDIAHTEDFLKQLQFALDECDVKTTDTVGGLQLIARLNHPDAVIIDSYWAGKNLQRIINEAKALSSKTKVLQIGGEKSDRVDGHISSFNVGWRQMSNTFISCGLK